MKPLKQNIVSCEKSFRIRKAAGPDVYNYDEQRLQIYA